MAWVLEKLPKHPSTLPSRLKRASTISAVVSSPYKNRCCSHQSWTTASWPSSNPIPLLHWKTRLKSNFQLSVNSTLVFRALCTLSRCWRSTLQAFSLTAVSNKLRFCLINKFCCWYLGSRNSKQVRNPVFHKFCVRQPSLGYFYISHFLVYLLSSLKKLFFNLFS